MRKALLVITVFIFLSGMAFAFPPTPPGGGGSGSMVYPAAGVPVSTGAAWDTPLSYTAAQINAKLAGVPGTNVVTIPCGGTDDTAALNAALVTLGTATNPGGTVNLVGICRRDGQWIIPLLDGIANASCTAANSPAMCCTGSGTGTCTAGIYRNFPIRITGNGGADANGRWTATTTTPPSALDLRYATGAIGKLVTWGVGYLEIDHITLMDKGSANTTPFIQTSNTSLNIHDVTFKGSTATLDSSNDGIILGGTTTTIGNATDGTAAFQGYQSIIEKNRFDQIRQVIQFRVHANDNVFSRNTISQTCSYTTGAPIVLSGYDSSNPTVGNKITDNLIEESNYAYGVTLNYAGQNTITGNGHYDQSAAYPTGYFYYHYNIQNSSTANEIKPAHYTAGSALVGGVAGLLDQNMVIDSSKPSIYVTTAYPQASNCVSTRRGLHLKIEGASGYPDLELICTKDENDTYTYKTAYSSYLGTELVTNGTFGAGSWTGDAAGGWLIGGGVVTHTAGSSGDFYQGLSVTRYKAYLVSYDLTITAGTFRIDMMGYSGLARSVGGVGLKEIFVTSNTDGTIYFTAPSTFQGTVDNVSVKEIIPY